MMEVTQDELEQRFGKLILKDNSGFIAIETAKISETTLLVAKDSPQRVLLRPLLAGKDHKKAKSCCDKRCSSCSIPMRSSATIGHFVQRRIRKALKKDKWASKFFTKRVTSALDKTGIQVYSAVNGTKRRSKELINV